jgi:hypothetical protein
MKIHSLRAKLFHADKWTQTDRQMDRHDEPIVAFPNIANMPKN